MTNQSSKFRWSLAWLGMGIAACARDRVSLGEDSASQPLTQSGRCAVDSIIDGDVLVTNQAELEALAGCEGISGDLAIDVFADTDLRPLASLRAVGGELAIGGRSTTLDNDAMFALIDAGWLPSFAGMEALERVGQLTLASFAASDLSPFSSLRYLNAADARRRVFAGQLTIADARNLVDLRGLEGVDGIRSLTLLDTPGLETLEGLTVGDRFGSVMLQKAPRLKNIDALARLAYGDSLEIIETGLEDLGSLSSLVRLQVFSIDGNPLLSDARSLPSPAAAYLSIARNPKLNGTLEIESPFLSSDIVIGENDELEAISINDREEHTGLAEGGSISIHRNGKLRSVTSPNGWDQLDSLEVMGNPGLEALDLGRLGRLDELHIRDNPGLFALSHAKFERIYVLDVVNNPLLSVSSLASVPAFERTLEGNAD